MLNVNNSLDLIRTAMLYSWLETSVEAYLYMIMQYKFEHLHGIIIAPETAFIFWIILFSYSNY